MVESPFSPADRERNGERERDDASDARSGFQSLGSASSPTAAIGRAQLWLTVYCNKRGLAETLVAAGSCTAEQFDEFEPEGKELDGD